MFATFSAIGSMIQSITSTVTTVFESANDIALIGRVNTMSMLKEAIDDAGDLKQLRADLQAIGLQELTKPSSAPAPKRVAASKS